MNETNGFLEMTTITLPTMKEDPCGPLAVTDWARANGALCSLEDVVIKGVKQKSTCSWYPESCGEKGLLVHAVNGLSWGFAGDRYFVIRPCFRNPEIFNIDIDKTGKLIIGGKISYYPRTKITGDIQIIRNIGLPFTVDETALFADQNVPFSPKACESFEIIVDGKHGYATKLDGTKKESKISSTYMDGTPVIEGGTEWFWLEPVSSEKQANGSIRSSEGIIPLQFEALDVYKRINGNNCIELNTNDFQIGRIMTDYILKELEKSSELIASLQNQIVHSENSLAVNKKAVSQILPSDSYLSNMLRQMEEKKGEEFEGLGIFLESENPIESESEIPNENVKSASKKRKIKTGRPFQKGRSQEIRFH